MKKTLITGLLVTAVSTSCFIPVSAYAKGQTEVKTVYAQNVIAPNTLSNSKKDHNHRLFKHTD